MRMGNTSIRLLDRDAVGTARESKAAQYVRSLDHLNGLTENERESLRKVTDKFSFRATDYYLGLIDWNDPRDPVRRLIVPHEGELALWGDPDPSDEASITQRQGVQHKYGDTALLLVNNACAGHCRYCFRKRIFDNGNTEANNDLSAGLRYIQEHKGISEILLTGGDPLMLPTRRLSHILFQIRHIPHVKVVRIGSKAPAFNPWRLSEDPELQECLYHFSGSGKKLYLMAHFDHPRELTGQAISELELFQDVGAHCVNQCPIVRGVNDDPVVLRELYERLSWIGVAPYYLFQCRPTRGNAIYSVPLTEAYTIFHEARADLSGLAKRARFVMSHATGKIEIAGMDDHHLYLKYHRAKKREDRERFMVFRRDDRAHWLDDLAPAGS